MSVKTAPAECDCGNRIDPDRDGEDASTCEWCQTPEQCDDCGSTAIWSRTSRFGGACWTVCGDCGEEWT